MVHPQKRILVKKALESTMAHLLELRGVLTKIKATDWFDMDVILEELQLTPDLLDVEAPTALATDRKRELVESETIMVWFLRCLDRTSVLLTPMCAGHPNGQVRYPAGAGAGQRGGRGVAGGGRAPAAGARARAPGPPAPVSAARDQVRRPAAAAVPLRVAQRAVFDREQERRDKRILEEAPVERDPADAALLIQRMHACSWIVVGAVCAHVYAARAATLHVGLCATCARRRTCVRHSSCSTALC
jgi:hypothetical protein